MRWGPIKGKGHMKEKPVLVGRREFVKAGLALGFSFTAPFLWPVVPAWAAARVGDVLPKATVSDLQGSKVAIPTDFKGKVVVIHFWATWCTYCAKEVAALQSLYNRYKSRGVIPCSVNVGESKETAAAFVEKQKVSYPFFVDPTSSVAKQYGVSGIPTTFIVNREGIVRFRIIGEITMDGLEKIVRSVL